MGSLSGFTENLSEGYSNPRIATSNADHLEMIEYFRSGKMGPAFESTFIANLHPSEMARCFPMVSKAWWAEEFLGSEISLGSWKAGSFSVVMKGFKIVAVKRTLEFRPNDTETDWRMTQYCQLNQMEDPKRPGVWMEDRQTFCHVYQEKRKAGGQLHDNERPMDHFVPEDYGTDGLLEYYGVEEANNQEAVPPTTKRARSTGANGKSDVWKYFTKIYIKEPDGKFKQAFAVCNFCHNLIKAPSSYGTNHLRSHAATCRCKQLQEQAQ